MSCVITVTRQFGSLGRPIARILAEKLNLPFYDRDIVEQTAAEMGLPISYVSQNEESIGGVYWKMKFPLGTSSRKKQDELYEVQSELIRSIASRGSCVIVGRCADYVLRDFKNTFHVSVFAPFEDRIRNCTERLGMDPETAMKMVVEVDRARERYHERYGKDGRNPLACKHLLVNSSYFGAEESAEMIAECVRRRHCLQDDSGSGPH